MVGSLRTAGVVGVVCGVLRRPPRRRPVIRPAAVERAGRRPDLMIIKVSAPPRQWPAPRAGSRLRLRPRRGRCSARGWAAGAWAPIPRARLIAVKRAAACGFHNRAWLPAAGWNPRRARRAVAAVGKGKIQGRPRVSRNRLDARWHRAQRQTQEARSSGCPSPSARRDGCGEYAPQPER